MCSFDRATTKTEVRIARVYSKHRKATAPLVCPVVKSMLRLTLASGGTPLLGKKYGHVSGSPLFCDYLDFFVGTSRSIPNSVEASLQVPK